MSVFETVITVTKQTKKGVCTEVMDEAPASLKDFVEKINTKSAEMLGLE